MITEYKHPVYGTACLALCVVKLLFQCVSNYYLSLSMKLIFPQAVLPLVMSLFYDSPQRLLSHGPGQESEDLRDPNAY